MTDSSVYELLVKTSIESFTVNSVSFAKGEEDIYDGLIIDKLVKKNLNMEVTYMVLSFCEEVEYLAITNCPASRINNMPTTCYFTLQNIGADQCIDELILAWSGTELCVMGCPGFDDDVLSTVDRYDSFNGEGMETLYIRKCYNFSTKALKKLVKTRNKNPQWQFLLSTILVDVEPLILRKTFIRFQRRHTISNGETHLGSSQDMREVSSGISACTFVPMECTQ